MSIRRNILAIISGLAIEAVWIWGSNHLVPWGLNRVNWRSIFVWIFFFAGFLTAAWLYLWTKLITRLFGNRKKQEAAPTPVAVQAIVQNEINQPEPAPEVSQNNVQNTPVQPETPTALQTEQPTTAQETTQATAPVTPKPAAPKPMAPPVRMNVQNNAILNVQPSGATTTTQTPGQTASTPTTQQTTVSQKEKDIATLADIDSDLDMMAFKHVALEGKIIDLVYSSDDVAVLCKLFSDDHTWTVDTTQPIEECTWTDETGDVKKPCGILISQIAALKKMEADAEIIPTIVMVRGSIQNFQEATDYLLQNKISLVQYENEKMSEATTLHTLLKEKFSLFPDDEEESDKDVAEDETTDASTEEEETKEEPQPEGQET